jgi:hypothetical protein
MKVPKNLQKGGASTPSSGTLGRPRNQRCDAVVRRQDTRPQTNAPKAFMEVSRFHEGSLKAFLFMKGFCSPRQSSQEAFVRASLLMEAPTDRHEGAHSSRRLSGSIHGGFPYSIGVPYSRKLPKLPGGFHESFFCATRLPQAFQSSTESLDGLHERLFFT